MQLRVSFGPTEKLMARAMGDEKGRKWLQMRRWNPNSTEGAPNGKSGLKAAIKIHRYFSQLFADHIDRHL